MNRILLVGCGNIGSRHLQGLLKFSESLIIDVVEPNDSSKNLAITRLDEISYEKTKHQLFWYRSIDEIKNNSDLTIIATTSIGRVDLINKLLEMNNRRFLIEKMVCQSRNEYDMLLDKMKLHNAKGWVNTPRRYVKSYQKIKDYFSNLKISHLSVITGNMGLGTNAIHFIDLFSWFTNNYDIKLNGDFLNNTIFSNKRGKDLMEFAGTIVGCSGSNSSLSITALPYDNLPIIVSVYSNNKYLIIDETNDEVIKITNDGNGDFKFNLELTSDLTTKIIGDILEKNNCLLPTLDNSYSAHVELFHIFNEHIKKIINEERKLCPIT